MSFQANGTGIPANAIDGLVGKAWISNVESIAANKTLSDADRRYQLLTPTGANRDVTFPSTGIVQGETWVIQCASGSSFALVVKASNGSTIATLNAGESLTFASRVNAPTASTDWAFLSQATQLPDGSLSVPSLRFSGASADTGIYSPGTDQIAFSQNGVQTLLASATGAMTFGSSTVTTLNHEFLGNTAGAVLKVTGFGAGGCYLRLVEDGAVEWFQGIDNASTILKIRPTSLATAAVAECTTAGAWTFGPTGFGGTHSVNGTMNVNTRRVVTSEIYSVSGSSPQLITTTIPRGQAIQIMLSGAGGSGGFSAVGGALFAAGATRGTATVSNVTVTFGDNGTHHTITVSQSGTLTGTIEAFAASR